MTCNYTYDITIYGSSCINVYDIMTDLQVEKDSAVLEINSNVHMYPGENCFEI